MVTVAAWLKSKKNLQQGRMTKTKRRFRLINCSMELDMISSCPIWAALGV
jgi:hypothetical protein